MAKPGWVCSECNQYIAVVFCTCDSKEVFICYDCMESHFLKKAGRTHASYDLAALKDYKTPGYMERREERVVALPKVRKQVSKSVKEVEKCIEEYCTKVDELVALLIKQKEETVELLLKKRWEIEDSLREVEDTLAEDQPNLKTVHGGFIREQLDSGWSHFSLFGYSVNMGNPQLSVTLNITMSASSELGKFPCIFGDKLRLYDLSDKHISEFSLPTSFTQGAVFCLLNNSSVLCLGGEPASTSVHLLDINTREITVMPDTRTPRSYPGVAKVDGNVFVFGSYHPSLASAEKLQLRAETWSDIRDMNEARSCFMPGVYRTDIYLLCLFEVAVRSLEVFNTESETYRDVPVQLPLIDECYVHTFFVGEELMIITSTAHIGRWKMQSSDPMRVCDIEDTSQAIVKTMYVERLGQIVLAHEKAMLSNCPAFVAGNEVFLVNYGRGSLLKVDFEACSVIT